MFIPLIVLAALLLTLQSTPGKTEREHDRLRGAVKSVTVHTAKLTKDSGKLKEGRRHQDRTVLYDQQGNKTKETIYTASPTITYINYRYDASGTRTDSVIVENPEGSGLKTTWPSGRSGDDRSTEVTVHVFAYAADGNRIEEKITRMGLALIGRALVEMYRHSYDNKGNRISTTFLSNDALIYTWTFTNDENGNVERMTKYSRDKYPLVTESYVYEFDAVGNWIKRFSFKEKGPGERLRSEPLQVMYRTIDYFRD